MRKKICVFLALLSIILTSCTSYKNETFNYKFNKENKIINSSFNNEIISFDCELNLNEIYKDEKESVFMFSSDEIIESLKDNYFLNYSYTKIYAYNKYENFNNGDPKIILTLSSNSYYKGHLYQDYLMTSYNRTNFGYLDKIGININNDYIFNFYNLDNDFIFSNHLSSLDNQYVFGKYYKNGIKNSNNINSTYLFGIKNEIDYHIEVIYHYELSNKNNDKKYEITFNYILQ